MLRHQFCLVQAPETGKPGNILTRNGPPRIGIDFTAACLACFACGGRRANWLGMRKFVRQ